MQGLALGMCKHALLFPSSDGAPSFVVVALRACRCALCLWKTSLNILYCCLTQLLCLFLYTLSCVHAGDPKSSRKRRKY
jgi:hypothetical protein